MLSFNSIKELEFRYIVYNRAKIVYKLNYRPIEDPLESLDLLKANTFIIKPRPYNNKPIKLFVIDRKLRYK